MRILSLDTATPVTGAALWADGRLVSELIVNSGYDHSRSLLRMIDAVLLQGNMAAAELDGIAVTIGPGSFTGVRIGLATAKGLALALQIPVIGIPTLDALAFPMNGMDHLICPLLNARKGEVYAALYEAGPEMPTRLTDYQALSPEALVAQCRGALSRTHGKMIFIGDGFPVFREVIEQALGEAVIALPGALGLPRIAAVAELAAHRLAAGEIDDIFGLCPIYVRASEAEIKLAAAVKEQK